MTLIKRLKHLMYRRRAPSSPFEGRNNTRLAPRKAENRKAGFIWCDQSQD